MIKAKTDDMILLHNGEPKVIGGVFETLDLEMENGSTIEVNCIYFNLDLNIKSTDFFLFNSKNEKLVNYSIGKKTNPFFEKMYLKVLSNPQNHKLKFFLDEFISDYVLTGIMGDFPPH